MSRTRCGLVAMVGLWAMMFALSSAAAADTSSAANASPTTQAAAGAGNANELCPVMPGTKVEASLWLDYEGQRIYFCHEVCKTRFRRAPEKYLANLPAAMQQAVREHQGGVATVEQPAAPAEHQHDHMTDHQPTARPDAPEAAGQGKAVGDQQGNLRRLGNFLGRFHPVAVHLPIALLLAAALAEGLFMWTRADWLAGAARFSVLLAAAGALLAASLGWLNAMSASYDGELQVLEYHRWLGTGTAALAVVVGFVSEMQRRRPAAAWQRAYRITLLLAAVLVSITGHFGGTLVYGVDYYKW